MRSFLFRRVLPVCLTCIVARPETSAGMAVMVEALAGAAFGALRSEHDLGSQEAAAPLDSI